MNNKKKLIAIELNKDSSVAIAEAIRHYANAVYPLSSTCAQVSREALHDVASSFEQFEEGSIQISRRKLPMIKAAVSWYFGDEGPAPTELLNDYLSILRPIKKA